MRHRLNLGESTAGMDRNDPFASVSSSHAPPLSPKVLREHQECIRQRALKTADIAEFLKLPRNTPEQKVIQVRRERRAAGDYTCDNEFAAGGL